MQNYLNINVLHCKRCFSLYMMYLRVQIDHQRREKSTTYNVKDFVFVRDVYMCSRIEIDPQSQGKGTTYNVKGFVFVQYVFKSRNRLSKTGQKYDLHCKRYYFCNTVNGIVFVHDVLKSSARISKTRQNIELRYKLCTGFVLELLSTF